ncbi:MAG: segregation/condensation protein A [Ruminococcaceae bacterium]|nr:segregation/condensation protein A [Oscillospiraceae bacterium]
MQELSFTLEIFEGPLELLLHLLKKNKVSIYDIPIEKITTQYLAYLEKMQAFDMELSSEFLLMASELLCIKSKMLLPRHEEEEEDPRKNLADRLLAYQRMKTAASFLKEHEGDGRFVFYKEPDHIDEAPPDYSGQAFDVEQLIAALGDVLIKTQRREPPPKTSFIGIAGHEQVSSASCVSHIKGRLSGRKRVSFKEVFYGLDSRPKIVVSFLIILEMIRLSLVKAEIRGREIYLTQIKDGEITNEF